MELCDDVLKVICAHLDLLTFQKLALATRHLRSIVHSHEAAWEYFARYATKLEVEAVQRQPIFGSDSKYTEEALLEALEVQVELVPGRWKDTIMKIIRTCRYCDREFRLVDVLQSAWDRSKQCNYHIGPYYSVHETVSWEEGGDSWDRCAWLCCRQARREDPGCQTGHHVERNLQISWTNVDVDALRDSDRPVAQCTDEKTGDRKYVPPTEENHCHDCNTAPCSCADWLFGASGAFADFDERELPKIR